MAGVRHDQLDLVGRAVPAVLAVCAVVMVTVSCATSKPDYAKMSGLTYGTTSDQQRLASRRSWAAADVAASALVIVAILAAYLYFRG